MSGKLYQSLKIEKLSAGILTAGSGIQGPVSLLSPQNGLSNASHGQPVHQGYHLVESIALAERPGTWHTQPVGSNANLDWNPHASVPRATSVVAHEAGVEAAKWIMEQLENGGEERRKLLIEWCKLLLERKELVTPLGIPEILIRRSSDPSVEVSSRVVSCLAKILLLLSLFFAF